MLAAIASLDVEVIGEVLEETHERDALIEELRNKITRRTRGSQMTQREILEVSFREIDTDGSGEINKKEFQALLVQMDMCYSGKRFKSLYNSIDRNNDGSLSIEELNHILFPKTAKEIEAQVITEKVRSQLEHQLTSLEEEASTELSRSGNITVKQHTRRLKKINSLKTLKGVPSLTSQSTIPLPATLESEIDPSADTNDVANNSPYPYDAEQTESPENAQNSNQSITHLPRRLASSPADLIRHSTNRNCQPFQGDRIRSQSQPLSVQSAQPIPSDELQRLNSYFGNPSLPHESSHGPSTNLPISGQGISPNRLSNPPPNDYIQTNIPLNGMPPLIIRRTLQL
jgi:Ca2+-binding EF-hand superfamily protein